MTADPDRDKRIEEIRERLERVTPGPWQHDLDCFDPDPPRLIAACVCDESGDMLFAADTELVVDGPESWGVAKWTQQARDANFIAHTREDLPWLLSEVERLRAEREALERVARAARFLVAEIQDYMKETGETMPREVDLAYLSLGEAVRDLARLRGGTPR